MSTPQWPVGFDTIPEGASGQALQDGHLDAHAKLANTVQLLQQSFGLGSVVNVRNLLNRIVALENLVGTPGGGGGGAGTIVGEVKNFAGTALPTGYLWCDGAAISRTTYADLFLVIGTAYGAGDGSTTFNVPNMQGRTAVGPGFSAGSGPTRTRGEYGGASEVALTAAQQNAPHWHTVWDVGHRHTFGGAGSDPPGHRILGAVGFWSALHLASDMTPGAAWWINAPDFYWTDHSYSGVQHADWDGAGWAHENMPPFTVVNFIIAYQ
jgi:microcystin-dependent protein